MMTAPLGLTPFTLAGKAWMDYWTNATSLMVSGQATGLDTVLDPPGDDEGLYDDWLRFLEAWATGFGLFPTGDEQEGNPFVMESLWDDVELQPVSFPPFFLPVTADSETAKARIRTEDGDEVEFDPTDRDDIDRAVRSIEGREIDSLDVHLTDKPTGPYGLYSPA